MQIRSWYFSEHRLARLISLCVALGSVFAYRSTLYVFFVQDDFWFLQAAQESWPNRFIVGGVLPDYWRPISTYWFHWVNVNLFGMQPFWHHLILLSFFGATVFVWGLALYEITGSIVGQLVGVTLYGLSQLHLYTLGWISGAIDVLAAFFLVSTLFLIWLSQRKPVPVWLITLALFLGVLSKEPVIIIVPLVLLSIAINARLYQKQLTRWEKRLMGWFVGLSGVYLIGWLWHTAGQRSAGEVGIYWRRGYTLLGNAISAIVPALDDQESLSLAWFLLPLLLLTIIIVIKKKVGLFGVIWGLGLYVVPVLPFVIFDEPFLQPYYAHFSILGISLLMALAITALGSFTVQWMQTRKLQLAAFTLVFICWLGFAVMAGQEINVGISQRRSPALSEAFYAQAAYQDIARWCVPEDGCQHIIFLDTTNLMWWATGKGVMIPVMFPGVQADFDGYFGYQAPDSVVTGDEILVLLQEGEADFKIVE